MKHKFEPVKKLLTDKLKSIQNLKLQNNSIVYPHQHIKLVHKQTIPNKVKLFLNITLHSLSN